MVMMGYRLMLDCGLICCLVVEVGMRSLKEKVRRNLSDQDKGTLRSVCCQRPSSCDSEPVTQQVRMCFDHLGRHLSVTSKEIYVYM